MTVVDVKSGRKEKWHRHQVALYVLGKKDPEISFLEEGHRYFWRDRELPSVTRVLGGENWKYTPGSAWRGQMVHKMVTLYLQGILDEDSLAEEWRGYLGGLKKFLASVGFFRILGVEEVVGDPALGFAGRRDFTIEYSGGPPGVILYLSAAGTYVADAVRAEEMPRLRLESINRIAEVRERERLTL